MAAEKELLVKLNVKPIGDTGLQKVAKDAKVAAAEVDRLGDHMDRIRNKRVGLSRETQREFALDFARGKAFAAGRGLPDAPGPAGNKAGAGIGDLAFLAKVGVLLRGVNQVGEAFSRLGKTLTAVSEGVRGLDKVFFESSLGGGATDLYEGITDVLKSLTGHDLVASAGIDDPYANEVRERRRARRTRAALESLGRGLAEEDIKRQFAQIGEEAMAAARAGLPGAPSQQETLQAKLAAQRARLGEIPAPTSGVPPPPGAPIDKRYVGDTGRLAALEDAKRAHEDILKTQQKIVELEQQAVEQLKREGEQRVAILERERDVLGQQADKLQEIVQQEQARLQGLKAGFGLLDPETQQAIKQLAGKVAAGELLTPEELEFAQRHQQFFQAPLERIGLERAEALGFDQIARQLGLTKALEEAQARQQQAEAAKVEIENKITAEVRLNEEALAQQIQERLIPAIVALQEQAAQAAANEIALAREREAASRRANYRGS